MPCIHEYLSARGHKFNDLINQFVQVLTIKHLPREKPRKTYPYKTKQKNKQKGINKENLKGQKKTHK